MFHQSKISFFKKAFQQSKQYGYEKFEKESSGCCNSCSCGCEAGQAALREKQRIEDKAEETDLRKEYEDQTAKDLKQLKIDQQDADKKQQDEAREKRLMKFT